jgi:hypothetical protein
MHRRWIIALLVMTALARAAVAVEPLEDELRRTMGAGGSVFILGVCEQPLEVRSVDGTRRRVLTPDVKLATRAIFDARSHVVWYQPRREELWALDLAAPVGTPPHQVAEGGNPDLRIGILHHAPREELGPEDVADVHLVLDGKAPGFARAWGPRRGRACRAAEHCPRIVDAPFLAEVARRAKGGHGPSPPERSHRVPAAGTDGCAHCGEAIPLVGSKLWAVYRIAREDCCHVLPALYDPIARQFIRLPEGERVKDPPREVDSIGGAWICAAGDALVTGQRGYPLAGAELDFGKVTEGAIGCIGGGFHFRGEDYACPGGADCDLP